MESTLPGRLPDDQVLCYLAVIIVRVTLDGKRIEIERPPGVIAHRVEGLKGKLLLCKKRIPKGLKAGDRVMLNIGPIKTIRKGTNYEALPGTEVLDFH